MKVLFQVPFSLVVSNPNGPGLDSVGTQLLGQQEVGDVFAVGSLVARLAGRASEREESEGDRHRRLLAALPGLRTLRLPRIVQP